MAAPELAGHLVSTDWLEEHLSDPDVRVLDIRGYVVTRATAPGEEEATYRGAPEEFQESHVPGAAFVDWTVDIIDPDDPVPAQVAPPERFAEAMAVRGVGNGTRVIAVDHMGGQFATRLWWALKYYGHDQASVLDGGWNRWVEEGRPVESGKVERTRATFEATPRPEWRTTAEALRDRLGEPGLQLLDARDPGQFSGARRRGPRGGHVPGAVNLPRELFFAAGGGTLPPEELRDRLKAHGLDPEAPTVAYCNGGVAATVALFNLDRLGFKRLSNYDGSWNEWGARVDLPIEGP